MFIDSSKAHKNIKKNLFNGNFHVPLIRHTKRLRKILIEKD